MEDAGGTGGFLLDFGISSDSSDSLGCEMMQTKVHPAIESWGLGALFPAILGTLPLVRAQPQHP